ncbi:acyl carrier protein [Amycolatopsis sp. H20-H5]|uniref:acyl carrier protein n=1 Tax=Amycolatopsis sp. H20-H5 TaxID=3046309 RepID=UPI002DBA2D70|nr:acyl carrier protein [Amycolatopsis sp. H20-H5]MEC3977523.1 acyl carrier protein [Amycolatopsis sp. H20-H5]
MSDLTSGVLSILHSHFLVDADVLAGDPTLEDIEFDSLAIVEFATAVEKRFHIPVDEDELTVDHTISQVIEILGQKLAKV